MVFQITWNITKNKYQGSYFGLIWLVLEPLLALTILYVVFSTLRTGAGSEFATYLLSGLVIFQVFTRGTQMGLTSLRSNEGIINSIKVNKEIFPVAAALASGLILAIQFGIFFVLAISLNHEFGFELIFLPIPLILLFLLILGFSYILSVVFVYIRDIQPAWGIFSYALFFISPIFWYIEEVDGILSTLHQWNPLGRIIELTHNAVFGQTMDIVNIQITTIFVLAILFTGFILFRKTEKKISEEL